MDGRMPGMEGPREVSPSEKPLDPEDQLRQDLEIAHTHALRALDALYRASGPKRSTLYRMSLGRAQSILIGLYKQELQRRDQSGTH